MKEEKIELNKSYIDGLVKLIDGLDKAFGRDYKSRNKYGINFLIGYIWILSKLKNKK